MTWLKRLPALWYIPTKRILPLLLGVVASLAVLLLWHQLSVREQLHVERLIEQEATAIESELGQELTAQIRTLQRMANRWEASGGIPRDRWEANAAAYVEDFSGFRAVEWVDSSFRVRWIVPLAGNEAAQNLNLGLEPHRLESLRIARDLRQPFVTRTISLIQGGKGFLASVPLYVGDRFDGFILGIFSFPLFFDTIVRLPEGYSIQIYDGTQLIYTQGALSQEMLQKTFVIEAYEVNWLVKIFPNMALLEDMRSSLPKVMLIGGLILVWLFVLVVYLAQVSYYRIHQVKETNRQLQREINQRHQIEKELQISQSRFAGILDIARDAVISVNQNQQITLFNQGAERIFGYTAEEVLGQPLALLLPERFVNAHHHYVNSYTDTKVYARPMVERGAIYGRRKDGSEFPAEASISKLNLDGEVIFTTFLRDVTVRQQAEAELRQMSDVLENAVSGISRLDTQGLYLYVNKAYASIAGYQPEEMIGMNWQQTVHPDEMEKMIAVYQQMLQDGRVEIESIGIRKDGSVFYKQLVMIATYDANHQFLGHHCFMKDITDRKQAEVALRQSEARFQAFMNHSPACAWITDANGTMLYANKTYFSTFALPAHDSIGKSIFSLYPPEIAQRFLDNIQQVAQTQKVLQAVEIAPRCDGTLGDFLVYKFPIPNSYGQLSIGGVGIDITQQHQAEEAVRKSEATKKAIIEAIPDLLIQMRSDGSYIDFIASNNFNIINPNLVRQGINVYEVLPPELAQQRMHYTQQALRAGKIQVYEQEIVIEGKLCYEEVRIVPLQQDEVLIVVRDITVAKRLEEVRNQAEEALRHQKEIFQTIVNHIPVMIALIDPNGRIEMVNPELERILGWSSETWQQEDVFLKCYPDPLERQSVLEHMLSATGKWKDLLTLTATGAQLQTSWANVRLSNGYVLGIGQDISDRKRKEMELRRAMEAAEAANLAKSIFLANMSHELRTPLNVILGFTQVLSRDSRLTPTQKEDLKIIGRSGDHLLSLINDVLDLSKIEAGHYSLEETSFDLIALLHSLRSMLSERASSKGLELQFDIAPDVPQFILADAQKLRQVLLNLLSNAIKFTDRGSIILQVSIEDEEIESQKTEAEILTDLAGTSKTNILLSGQRVLLQFKVADTGYGIASEELDTIFDAFVQAQAGKKSGNGTGLGLTISRKLLELMEGTICVSSTLGKGSDFTFTIPVRPTSGVNTESVQNDRLVIGLAPNQPHRRILVVDDQKENRLLLVRLLTHLGLEVREAANGKEAVQIWQEWYPDLTWMDIRMPVLDGYEATKQIRAMETGQTCIIIALTAQASQSDRTLALTAGCNDYISKPFREETLFLKMAQYLGVEYIYAESKTTSNEVAHSTLENDECLNLCDRTIIASFPKKWFAELETAAICGDDTQIAQLVAQLPSSLGKLANRIIEMADNYQFEEIVQLLSTLSREF